MDDIPISNLEGKPDERVDVTAVFKATHECKHHNPEAILDKELLTWSIVSAELTAFAIPPAAPAGPVDVSATFSLKPTTGETTKLTGTGLDKIGDYHVTIKVKGDCEWTVNGKKETADGAATIDVTFHVYTVFIGVHAADFKQDDDFVMLLDKIGETRVDLVKDEIVVDKHEEAYPFRENCFATVLGHPAVLPVKTAIGEPTKHYSFIGLDKGGAINIPKLPAWKRYAIRGEKRSEKVDDVQQVGTFAGKTSKDQGTVFEFEGTLEIYDINPYVVNRVVRADIAFQVLDVKDPKKGPGFRARCAAHVIPAGSCNAPQVKGWEIGYVQNVISLSAAARYLPNQDKNTYRFADAVDSKTEFLIPNHVDSTVTLPTPMRDHSTRLSNNTSTGLRNCGRQKPHSAEDTPTVGDPTAIRKTFPTEAPAPIVKNALQVPYSIDDQTYTVDLFGWCVAHRGRVVVPLQQVSIELRLDAKKEGCKAVIPEGKEPGPARDPPITDGQSANEYLESSSALFKDGPVETVVIKP
jgi:hypothetical protein